MTLQSTMLKEEFLQARYWNAQKDQITAEWKYRINGKTISGDEIELIVKLSPTNKLVIITVYEP